MSDKPIDVIGGPTAVRRIVQSFYDALFADVILSQFFEGVTKEHQVDQFTDFLIQFLGGEKNYRGRMPQDAHTHLYITEEHFLIRHEMLANSLKRHSAPENIVKLILQMDQSFYDRIVKKSVDECEGRYKTEKIIAVIDSKLAS